MVKYAKEVKHDSIFLLLWLLGFHPALNDELHSKRMLDWEMGSEPKDETLKSPLGTRAGRDSFSKDERV